VNYREGDAAARIAAIAPGGVDHIVEVSLAQNAGLDGEVIANHGSIAYYANDGGEEAAIPVSRAFAKNVRIQGLLLYTVGDAALSAAAEDISAALRDGALPAGEQAGLPLTWFALEETAAAHDAVEHGAVGKVLIDVSGDNH
jgi:NADPH2:quinone reductase